MIRHAERQGRRDSTSPIARLRRFAAAVEDLTPLLAGAGRTAGGRSTAALAATSAHRADSGKSLHVGR